MLLRKLHEEEKRKNPERTLSSLRDGQLEIHRLKTFTEKRSLQADHETNGHETSRIF